MIHFYNRKQYIKGTKEDFTKRPQDRHKQLWTSMLERLKTKLNIRREMVDIVLLLPIFTCPLLYNWPNMTCNAFWWKSTHFHAVHTRLDHVMFFPKKKGGNDTLLLPHRAFKWHYRFIPAPLFLTLCHKNAMSQKGVIFSMGPT